MEICIIKNTNNKYITETTTIDIRRTITAEEALSMVSDRLEIGDQIAITQQYNTNRLDDQYYPIYSTRVELAGLVVKVPRKQTLRLEVTTKNDKPLRTEKEYINL